MIRTHKIRKISIAMRIVRLGDDWPIEGGCHGCPWINGMPGYSNCLLLDDVKFPVLPNRRKLEPPICTVYDHTKYLMEVL